MNHEVSDMDQKKMRAIATDFERAMKRHKPNYDEAIVVCVSLACACLDALAKHEDADVGDLFDAYVMTLARSLGLDDDEYDGEALH